MSNIIYLDKCKINEYLFYRNTEFRLMDNFFQGNSSIVNLVQRLKDNNILDEIIRGMTKQESENADSNMVEDLRGRLFAGRNDLFAVNIQRGRDHGLPPYVTALKDCSARDIKSWEDLQNSNMMRNRVRK